MYISSLSPKILDPQAIQFDPSIHLRTILATHFSTDAWRMNSGDMALIKVAEHHGLRRSLRPHRQLRKTGASHVAQPRPELNSAHSCIQKRGWLTNYGKPHQSKDRRIRLSGTTRQWSPTKRGKSSVAVPCISEILLDRHACSSLLGPRPSDNSDRAAITVWAWLKSIRYENQYSIDGWYQQTLMLSPVLQMQLSHGWLNQSRSSNIADYYMARLWEGHTWAKVDEIQELNNTIRSTYYNKKRWRW